MKKLIALSLFVFCLLSTFSLVGFHNTAYADEQNCKSYYLFDYDTGTVLSSYNENERRPIASMVKIMTLLLSYEAIDDGRISLDQEVTISENASSMGGSQMFLEAGDVYKVEDLLKGITVVSANDASVQMAEVIGGSVEKFVSLMNDRAESLGMKDTVFVNCTGLPADRQYSTARDVSVMMRELLGHKEYYNYSKTYIEDYTHPDGRVTQFVNTNKLVRFYSDCDGGKTGFTNDAKFCLSATAKRDNMRVIATVLGGDDSKARFNTVTKLFNYAFSQYEKEVFVTKTPIENNIIVENGKSESVVIEPATELKMLINKSDRKNYVVKVDLADKISAPISIGDVIGKIYVENEKGERVLETDLVSLDTIEKESYWDILKRVIGSWPILG